MPNNVENFNENQLNLISDGFSGASFDVSGVSVIIFVCPFLI